MNPTLAQLHLMLTQALELADASYERCFARESADAWAVTRALLACDSVLSILAALSGQYAESKVVTVREKMIYRVNVLSLLRSERPK